MLPALGAECYKHVVTSNPVFHFFHTAGNLGPALLRWGLAWIFFYHGSQKAFGLFGGAGWFETIALFEKTFGLPAPMAATVIVGELLLVLSLITGFCTRLAGLGVAVIMTGAVVLLSEGGGGYAAIEFPALVLVCGLTLCFTGAGIFSVDRFISRNLLPSVG